MHRKLDDIDSNYDRIDPVAKKIKNPNMIFDQSKLNNNNNESFLLNNKQWADTFMIEPDKLAQNGLLKLGIRSKPPAQSSSTVFPNRKRRSRNLQEMCGVNPLKPMARTSVNGQTRKKTDLSCVVCHGLAHGYNFDAISCESCKAFFRRNALFNMDRLKCRRGGVCEITLETRRKCKSCRLKKCFNVGMRKEWILTEEEKISKKRRIEENRRLRTNTADEPVLETEETTNPVEKSDLDLQNVLLIKNEKPSLKSTSSAQSSNLITNVVMAFDDGFKLDPTSYGWSYPVARKLTALCQILHTKNTTALRLINFYKRLHEFDSLNEIDKINLIKTNLHLIFFFHSSLGYDPINDIYYEENSTNDTKPVYGADILEAYGTDAHIRCTLIIRALHSIAQIDKRIIQLALVIFLFSKSLSHMINSNESLLNNYQQVFQIQNKYTEQLWLLMEKNYGTNRAALIFSTLITKCLLIRDLLSDIHLDKLKLDPCQVPPIIRSIMQLS